MNNSLRPVLVLFVLLTVITGGIYPLVVTAVSQAVFSRQANGSLIEKSGKPVGSALIGQQFDAPYYFWGRVSATTPNPYNAQNSAGSCRRSEGTDRGAARCRSFEHDSSAGGSRDLVRQRAGPRHHPGCGGVSGGARGESPWADARPGRRTDRTEHFQAAVRHIRGASGECADAESRARRAQADALRFCWRGVTRPARVPSIEGTWDDSQGDVR